MYRPADVPEQEKINAGNHGFLETCSILQPTPMHCHAMHHHWQRPTSPARQLDALRKLRRGEPGRLRSHPWDAGAVWGALRGAADLRGGLLSQGT